MNTRATHSGEPEDERVSVIIPAYNRAWSLPRSVGSVFAQTYRPLECIVVDDGSTDNTAAVLDGLRRECPADVRFRAIHAPHGGANGARNRGLAESSGAWLCFLDSDDILTADSVALRAGILRERADVDLCYGRCDIRDEQGQAQGSINTPWPPACEARVARYLFITSSPMMRRALCERAGPWREDDPHGQEYEYFARLKAAARNVVFLDQVLHVYVKHARGSLFDRSPAFYRSYLWAVSTIKAQVLGSPHDNRAERLELAREFHKAGINLYRLRDFESANVALRESLALKFRLRGLARLALAVLRAGRSHG